MRNGRHDITVHETPDPGRTFGIECSCGERWVAFFGEAQVEEIIDEHHRANGIERKVVIL